MDYSNFMSDPKHNVEEIDIIRFLLNIPKDEETLQIAPSRFFAQMRLSTEEQLEKQRKLKKKYKNLLTLNFDTFDVTPEIVVFQNFKPGMIYTTLLSLRNSHSVSRPLRGIFEPSPYFSVSYASEAVSTHTAPGMSVLFNIKFCAEDVKDYKYNIKFVTEGETFIVPVIALSPRPLLDLPDQIYFKKAAVKVGSEHSILVRNLGQASAVFTINTNVPFSVNLTKGVLLPKQDMELTVYFRPVKLGQFEDYLLVTYQTGEQLSIRVTGSSENSNIYLEKEILQFQQTFIGLTRQKNVTLYNNSSNIAKFQWKLYSCSLVDQEYGRRIKNCLNFMKEHESIKDNKLNLFNIIDATGHAKIYTRIFEDEVEEFEAGDKFLYQNPNFEIIPLQGEIWPGGTINFTIIFSPAEVYYYQNSAYLEITGLQERVKLILNGIGIGPHVELNLESLNANQIYMCAVHQYEVVAANKGDIPAEVSYKPTESDFGGDIRCWPAVLNIKPYKCGTFVLQFSSTQQGKFFEEIQFEIKGSGEIIKFILMGDVVCPLLNLEVSEVDFGVVPIGYAVHQPLVLHNQSMVPIEFVMSIHNDGEIPAMSCEEYASLPIKCGPYDNVREFGFSPRVGVVAPNSRLCVQLTVTANIMRSCLTTLTVNLWGSNRHSISLPIKYKACIPHVVCMPSEISIKFCFVTYPYKRTIVLYNDSQIPGFFQVFAQTPSKAAGITCTTSISEGHLKPHEKMEIDLTITTTYLGEDKLSFFIKLFGDQPLRCCSITCIGQGPVVTMQPDTLDFEKVKLLERTTKNLTITNNSPISAFIATCISPKTPFAIEPRTLELQAEESANLTISVYLCNPGKIQDKLQLVVENGTNALCYLKAKGVGASIFCEPRLDPELNVGTLLTCQDFSCKVKFTNKGFRAHKMFWSRNKNLKQLKENTKVNIPSIFTLTPKLFDLSFGETIEAAIEGVNTNPGLVEEDFYCHALIDQEKSQTVIISFNLKADFVDPVIGISKNKLSFRKDVGPEKTNEFLVDEVTVTNKSNIKIQMNIYLKDPFCMFFGESCERKTSQYMELNHNQSLKITVEFDPPIDNKRCFVVHEKLVFDYLNHPKIDQISLMGEVNFPNIEIIPNMIQFFCLPTNTIDYHDIMLKNISPLPVTYNFEWQEEAVIIENLESTKIIVPDHTVDSSFSKKSSDSGSYLRELELRKAKEIEQVDDKGIKKIQSSKETLVNVTDLDMDVPVSPNLLPVEYIFHKSYIEKKPSYYYTEITEKIKPPLYMKDVLNLPEQNKIYAVAMQMLLNGLVANFHKPEQNDDIIKTLPKKHVIHSNTETVLDIAPAQGFLKPNECQLVSVAFHPLSNMSVVVEAQCHVLGGVTQTVNITGMSSDLSYSIEDIFIDFGRRVFCELCEKSLTLSNTGHIEFTYLASAREFPDPIPIEFLLEAGCLTVTPKQGVILPGDCAKLHIQYFPGIAGEFNETFTIEIGYLPAITVTVHGYGVFPQTYLYLPRPTFTNLKPCISYLAIATLTADYLLSLKNIKTIMPYNDTQTQVYDEDVPKIPRQKLKKAGWVIISYNDLYPTIMDIDLAIERVILYQHLFDNPAILLEHTRKHRAMIVPDFTTPPYLVDFGYVILDTVVHYTVLIFNYGPVIADIRLMQADGGKKSPFIQTGLAIQFTRSFIPVGDTRELFVVFNPTAEAYPELDYDVCVPFHLNVGHGSKIPVIVKATVTVPAVTTDTLCVDFEEVQCGNCVKKSLVLHNKGHVISEWRAVVKKRTRKNDTRRYSIELIRKKPVFFLKKAKGILTPGSTGLLDIYFEPQFEGHSDWLLVIYINQNSVKVLVNLKGVGLKPTLKITEELVEFEPVLPYVEACEKFFTIENISSFPIEFYFADFDLEIMEEERIINLLTQFYEQDDLYIPPRTAGQKLPTPFRDFYDKLMESLREKLIHIGKEKIEEEKAMEIGSLTEINLERRTSIKKKSLTSKNRSQASSLRFVIEPTVTDPILVKTPEEIEVLLHEHLKQYSTDSNLVENSYNAPQITDPLAAAILEAKGPPVEKDPTAMREGVFIIFHGAPTTNVVQAANKAGLNMNLPVYSLDRLFLEVLVANSSSAAVNINEVIDGTFKEIASEIDLLVAEGTDAFDELQKKIDLIQSGKEKKPKPKPAKESKKGKKGDSAKSESKKSSQKSSQKEKKESSKKTSSKGSKKEKKKKKDTRPTFMGLPENLIFDILKQKLSLFETGIIIESLHSIFLRQPLLALNNVLKAIGNVQYIQCIILSYSYAENLIVEESLKQQHEKNVLEERETIIEKILEMDDNQFTRLSPEEFAIFREYFLKQRKLNTIAKRESLKRRLLDLKFGKKVGKNKPDSKDVLKKRGETADRKSMETTNISSAKSKQSKSKPEKESSKKSKQEKESSKSSKSKKNKKGKAKLSPEEAEKKQDFNTFENDLQVMLHILEHWDRKSCTILKPFPIQKGGSKGKSSIGKKQSSKGSTKVPSGKKAITPSKTSLLRLPVEHILLTPELELKYKQNGIPCWLLLNAHKDKPVETMVANYLRHTSELVDATKSLEESLKEKVEEVIELYTVVHSTKQSRERNVSDVFILRDATIPCDPAIEFVRQLKEGSYISVDSESARRSIDSKINLGSKPKKRRRSTERHRSSKQSVYSVSSPKRISVDRATQLCDADTGHTFTPRSVLNPGETLRYGINFKPEACGTYEHKFTIEIMGWPSKYHLTCSGKCDIPKIDMRPESIFAKTVYKRYRRYMYENNLFIRKLNVFDFGPVLLQAGEDIKLLTIETNFNLTNSSLLPCESTFALRDDSEIYAHEPEMLTVQPNCTEVLRMLSKPILNENTDNQLIISIKNNPKIESINLTSDICKFEFSLSPKLIQFDHTLINRTEQRCILFANDSLVAVNWQLIEPNDILEHFNISPVKGQIMPKSIQEIIVEYSSNKPEDVPQQKLEIQVYDQDYRCTSPLHTDYIEISAEAIEVIIECKKEIHFGEVKGRFQHILSYTMLNKGKYNVEFTFIPTTEDQDELYAEHKSLRNYFVIAPTNGILLPNKVYAAKLTFFAKKVVDLKNLPIFNCVFTDPLYKTVIEMFPVVAFAKTFLAGYELCPPEQINFGYQLVGSEKVQEMTLTNHGRFEFNYTVLNLRKLLEMNEKKGKTDKKGKESKSSKSSKSKQKSKESKKSDKGPKSKSSKSSKSDQSGKKKAKPTKLDAGMFSLISSTGVVEPNGICKIQVFSRPKQAAKFEETVVFFISECSAAEKKGHFISLVVTGCAPSVNFQDYNGIFREQYIVNTISELECPKEIGAYCVFIKDDTRLHFGQVMINKEATARIRLENNGPIPADVVANITSFSEDIFSIKPDRFNIDTYSTSYTTISFLPNGINTFSGILNISYECPASFVANKLEIKLTGEGLVPEVALTQPVFDDVAGCFAINFNPTLIGTIAHQTIRFENVGILSCQVIIEVCEGTLDDFILVPHSDTIPLLKIQEKFVQATAHSNLVSLHPGQTAEFDLRFSPTNRGEFKCLVKLHLVNNPFETFMIFVTAESYNEDIIIEGLPAIAIKKTNSSEHFLFVSPGYELDFGYCFINVLHKKYFKISNHSLHTTYKFEISSCQKLMFIPAVGHLKPRATKDIIATFSSKQPMSLYKEPLKCTIFKIEYLNPELEPLSWDERQNFVIWEPIASPVLGSPTTSIRSKQSNNSPSFFSEIDLTTSSTEAAVKTIQEKAEPQIEITPGSLQCLPLLVTVACAYSSYKCSEQEINMTDTLAFEIQSSTFQVTNTSDVSLDLCWKIFSDEGYPRRIHTEACDSNLTCNKPESDHSNKIVQLANQIPTVSHICQNVHQRPAHLMGTEKFLPGDAVSCISFKSSLFSSEANISNRSNDSWIESDVLPFTITPNSVSLKPKETRTFKVTFTPKDVFSYVVHLRSEFLNLNPLLKQLDILVKARSLLPLVHFDLEPNDYLDVREGPKFCRDVTDESTKIVEFEAIGLGISCFRTFNILNPTAESFSYDWTLSEINDKDVSQFHCHKPEGFVEKGKLSEAIFSFLPQATGTFEAFYMFNIRKYNLSRMFLLLGIAREPRVHFAYPYLQIRPTTIGIDVTETVTIKNNENMELDFKFKNDSLYSDAHLQVLVVQPKKGILGPHGEQQINITFHPVKRGEVNFTLKCIVDKMQKPLLLNITANCFDIQPVVSYQTMDGNKIILDSENINTLDLKTMAPHIKEEINFTIRNAGIIGFYYAWNIKEDSLNSRVKITFSDKTGYIKSRNEICSIMSITPLTKVVLKNLIIKLEIRYGPTYLIHLTGTAAEALFTFSVDEYDFGPCLIQKEVTSYYKKIIEFTNNEETPILLECKIPDQDHLSVNFKSKLIAPKTPEQLLITFHPHEIKQYYTEIEFYINSKLHVLKIQGEGVTYSIELWDTYDKFIDLGSVPVGKTSTKTVQVVNNSRAVVDIIFDLYDRLPYFTRPQKILKPEFEIEEKLPPSKKATSKEKNKPGKKDKKGKDNKNTKTVKGNKKESKKDKSSKSTKSSKSDKKEKKGKKLIEPKAEIPVETPEHRQQRLIREFVTFFPKKFTRVAPQQALEFAVTFSPTERMKTFTEKVSCQVQDNIETMCLLRACSIGPDYQLEKNCVAFGSIIQGCFSKQKLVLYNKGETGGSFKWTFQKPQIYFMISPKEGYISPGTNLTFSIKYKPTHISCLFQTKAICTIADLNKPLELLITGSCFDMPPPKGLIKFSCPVRGSDRKDIVIQNPSGQMWTIKPAVNGQYFIAPEDLIVHSRSNENCEIIYKPLTMSKEKPHEASVFFQLPEGQGILYNLMGTAQHPLPVDTITREIICKTYHSEVLNVKNWLKTPQKFAIITESALPHNPNNKTLYKLTGNDVIDVPSQSERDYVWTIYVLNEGVLKFKIMFQNICTKEYILYEISLTVAKCPSLEVIKLTTCIRIPIKHTLNLQNPIKTPVVFTIQSTSPELSFENPVIVPPYSEHPVTITYIPLSLGETEAHLDISTKELGIFPYDFVLTAHPPVPEPYVCFTTGLGQVVSQKAHLFNTASSNQDFICEMKHPEIFYISQTVSVASKQSGEFDICFEPNSIGNIQSTLTLSSAATGPYIYPLIGTCTLPKPQGPYFIKPGGSTTIVFNNPFTEDAAFNFAVEPAIFSLKSTVEDVKARKDVKVVVNLLPLKNLEILIDQKYPITGKLVVYSTQSDLSFIKWIYYLQGDLSY